MNYLDGNEKCLAEIFAAITPEDDKNYLLALDYVKHYKGPFIGTAWKDGYENECELFPIPFQSTLIDIEPDYHWESFRGAKKLLKKDNYWKIFHVKKGIKIAFEHEMLLASFANDMKPKWARLYDEWFSQMADYRMRFATEEDLKRKAEFIQGLVDVANAAVKKNSN